MITDHAAVDTELGVLKTGKEADVHLVERAVPGTARASCSPRSATAAPSTGCSTATPATSRAAGSAAPARRGRWPGAPSSAATCSPGSGRPPSSPRWPGCGATASPCPTRCQLAGTELLLEFVGSPDGSAAPRLAQLRPDPDRAGRPVAPARRRPARAGPPRPDPRRPVGVQPARGQPGRCVEPARGDRPAAGRRRGRQPAGAGVPRAGRGPGRRLVRRARAARRGGRGGRARSRSCARTCTFPGQAAPAQPHTPEKVTPIDGEGGGPIGRASRMLDHERPAVPA